MKRYKTVNQFAILLLVTGSMVNLTSCEDCRYQDCRPAGDYVELRYVRDGKNALFGLDAFIDKDSIDFELLGGGFSESIYVAPVYFNEENQTLGILLEDPYKYRLRLGSVRTDTLEGIASVFDYEHCCAQYELKYVYVNGEIACLEDCGEVVEVEI